MGPVWVAVLSVFFVSTIVSGVVPLRGDPGRAASLLICVFAAALGWRLFRLAALGTADGRLVLRNHWRDRTLHRDDVTGVTVERVGRGGNRSVHLRLRDGSTVGLDVTEVPFLGRGRLERQADEVRAWLSERPGPFL